MPKLNHAIMKKGLFVLLILSSLYTVSSAQRKPAEDPQPPKPEKAMPNRILNVDSAVVTKHQVTIKGKVVPYTATAGTMPVWDE